MRKLLVIPLFLCITTFLALPARAHTDPCTSTESCLQFNVNGNIKYNYCDFVYGPNVFGTCTYVAPSTPTYQAPVYTPAPEPVREKSSASTVIFPDTLKKEGSTTSNLAELFRDEAVAYYNLTFEDTALAKIIFTQPLDLNNDTVIAELNKIAEGLVMGAEYVEVNNEILSTLSQTPALLSFYNVTLSEYAPGLIYKNDEQIADETTVTDISYTKENKLLSFKVQSFSEYALGSGLSVENANEDIVVSFLNKDDNSYNLKGKVLNLNSTVSINDEAVVLAEDGTFEYSSTLAEGENTFSVRSTSPAGIVESNEFTVSFSTNAKPIIVGAAAATALLLALVGGGAYMLKNRKPKVEAKD